MHSHIVFLLGINEIQWADHIWRFISKHSACEKKILMVNVTQFAQPKKNIFQKVLFLNNRLFSFLLFFVAEINECLNFGTCSHYCTNTKGSYKCTCDKNYKDMNGSCIAKGKDLYFLLTWPLASLWHFT